MDIYYQYGGESKSSKNNKIFLSIGIDSDQNFIRKFQFLMISFCTVCWFKKCRYPDLKIVLF